VSDASLTAAVMCKHASKPRLDACFEGAKRLSLHLLPAPTLLIAQLHGAAGQQSGKSRLHSGLLGSPTRFTHTDTELGRHILRRSGTCVILHLPDAYVNKRTLVLTCEPHLHGSHEHDPLSQMAPADSARLPVRIFRLVGVDWLVKWRCGVGIIESF
jgi:hypothetical protein